MTFSIIPISWINSSTLPSLSILSLYSLNTSSHSPMTSCKLPLPNSSTLSFFKYSSCYICCSGAIRLSLFPSHRYLIRSTNLIWMSRGLKRNKDLWTKSILLSLDSLRLLNVISSASVIWTSTSVNFDMVNTFLPVAYSVC